MGDCCVNINKLRDGQRHDMWLALQNIKMGRLHLAVTVSERTAKVGPVWLFWAWLYLLTVTPRSSRVTVLSRQKQTVHRQIMWGFQPVQNHVMICILCFVHI